MAVVCPVSHTVAAHLAVPPCNRGTIGVKRLYSETEPADTNEQEELTYLSRHCQAVLYR